MIDIDRHLRIWPGIVEGVVEERITGTLTAASARGDIIGQRLSGERAERDACLSREPLRTEMEVLRHEQLRSVHDVMASTR